MQRDLYDCLQMHGKQIKTVAKWVDIPTSKLFIPGRLITDNAIIAFECLHAI